MCAASMINRRRGRFGDQMQQAYQQHIQQRQQNTLKNQEEKVKKDFVALLKDFQKTDFHAINGTNDRARIIVLNFFLLSYNSYYFYPLFDENYRIGI